MVEAVPASKYKSIKRKLREVLEENEFLSAKLWNLRTRLRDVERERDELTHRLKKRGKASSAGAADVISDSDDSTAAAVPTPVAQPEKTKKEPRKRRPVTSKVIKIQKYDVTDDGSPVLPLTVGTQTVLNFGTILHDRLAYHTERYIFPVGYKIHKSFLSVTDPERNGTYVCEILDGGDVPKFVVTPEDCPDRAVTAASATGAWIPFLKAAYALRQKEHTSGLSGPDFFGLTQGVVIKCIQELPNARLCKNYVWQEFEFVQARAPKRLKREKIASAHTASSSVEAIVTPIMQPSTPADAAQRSNARDDDDLDGDDSDAIEDSMDVDQTSHSPPLNQTS